MDLSFLKITFTLENHPGLNPAENLFIQTFNFDCKNVASEMVLCHFRLNDKQTTYRGRSKH